MSKVNKKNIAVVVTSVLMIKFFLVPHISALSKKYELTLILKNDFPEILKDLNLSVQTIEVPIERKISIFRDLFVLIKLIHIFYKCNFDMVHTLTPKAGLLGIVAAWFTCVPVRVHTFQGEVWSTKRGFYRTLLKFLDWLVGFLSTHLTVVSGTERDFLVKEGIIKRAKSVVLGNGSICGVDVKKFAFSEIVRNEVRSGLGLKSSDVVFLYVGRLNPDKGIIELLGAFEKLSEARHNVKLLLVGVDEDGYLRALLDRKPTLSEMVISLGYSSNPETYMSGSDVLVLPSHREGFGMVIVESAAIGIPSIASNIYGIQDAIDHEVTGLLFDVGDVNDLFISMKKLVDDHGLRLRLGSNAKERTLKLFEQGYVVDSMISFYDELLNPDVI
jgi:glycosyltransferase involved in cell wall biosynthesis